MASILLPSLHVNSPRMQGGAPRSTRVDSAKGLGRNSEHMAVVQRGSFSAMMPTVLDGAREILNPSCQSFLTMETRGKTLRKFISSAASSSFLNPSCGQATRLIGLRCRAGADEGDTVASNARQSPAVVKEKSGLLPPGWPTVGLALFGLGFLLGPPLDGIHSRVQLQIYDNGAINIFGLQTNIWVPPLLGIFYCIAGLLQLVLDKRFAPEGKIPEASLTKVATSFISLAVLLELSAEMYKAGVPFNLEAYALFFLAEVNWLLLENTWWGFALACIIGVGCPLAEIPIVNLFGLWHYPRANVSLFGAGFISWVICCYFFYTPFISNLARWLNRYQQESAKRKQ